MSSIKHLFYHYKYFVRHCLKSDVENFIHLDRFKQRCCLPEKETLKSLKQKSSCNYRLDKVTQKGRTANCHVAIFAYLWSMEFIQGSMNIYCMTKFEVAAVVAGFPTSSSSPAHQHMRSSVGRLKKKIGWSTSDLDQTHCLWWTLDAFDDKKKIISHTMIWYLIICLCELILTPPRVLLLQKAFKIECILL